MKPLSIRASVTLWFIGLVSLLLAAFSALLYLGIERALLLGEDNALMARADAVAAMCDWDDERGELEVELDPGAVATPGSPGLDQRLEVWAWPTRKLLYRAGDPIAAAMPADAGRELTPTDPNYAEPNFATLEGPWPLRLCEVLVHHRAVPAEGGEQAKPEFDVLVRTANSLVGVEYGLSEVRVAIAVLAGFSFLVVLAFGFVFSRRFVRPLRELGSAAAELRQGTRASMPTRGTGDEIDALARTLDESFTALQDSLHRQTRFTADAAHELRNPISVVRNAAEVSLRQPRTPEEYREFLLDVLATSKRMENIVEALLLLARMDAGAIRRTFEPVDLAAIVGDAVAAQAAARDRIHYSNGAPGVVHGDGRLLRILVDNLLSNALRYSPARESVEVEVGTAGGEIRLRVKDHGPGVPPSEKERIFERFYRVEAANPGSPGAGLGLAIVHEVAQVHSAKCGIESSGAGTEVTVSFPSGSHPPGSVHSV
jgi:signal transduction histidine kinase